MHDVLSAASPIEIEALVDAAGLGEAAQRRALALFHELTSRLELAGIGLARRRATEWPAHRLWWELRPGALAALLRLLAAEPDTLQLAEHPGEGMVAPGILYVTGEAEGHAGVLVACADPAALDALTRRIDPPDAA